jgi:hypothetical protein
MCLPGKTIKDARASVKSGTATEREKSIVESMTAHHTKGRASKQASKGTLCGYVVLDDKGVERNARLHIEKNKPRFHINSGNRKKFYISTGCSELEIGSRHTCQGHTFTVLVHAL